MAALFPLPAAETRKKRRAKIAAMRIPSLGEGDRRVGELLTAFRFFTRIPLGAGAAPEPGALARASWAFPIVGVAIGIVCAAAFAVSDVLHFPRLAAALIAIGAGVFVTGGLHEDGLADTADAFGGSDPAERLAIMRDSRSGAYAILAIVLSVAIRAAAVAALPGKGAVLGAFVAAHAVARGALPAVLFLLPAARTDGLGASAGVPAMSELLWSLGIAAVLALLALGIVAGIAALAFAAFAMAVFAALVRRQIGGHTGDVLGAIEQKGETAMLLAAAAWAW
jgi:adenosylcobinamide-GDP ribazoletransferase